MAATRKAQTRSGGRDSDRKVIKARAVVREMGVFTNSNRKEGKEKAEQGRGLSYRLSDDRASQPQSA